MTVGCPKGHESGTEDWCDVCGARIGPAAEPAGRTDPLATTPGPDRTGCGTPTPCPACATANDPGTRYCEQCGADLTAPVAARPAPAADPEPGPTSWEAVATADRAYFDRIECDGLAFPDSYAERRFPLRSGRAVIGRRSSSADTAPEINLSVAPEDVGVSHRHAALVEDDGGWCVVDLGSSNGTYLNDSPEPLEIDRPRRLEPGDRIHVGAWTTIEVRASGSPSAAGS